MATIILSHPAQPVDVLPPIKKWLHANSDKITSFWVGADWNNWARYELYVALDQALGDPCLVRHSADVSDDYPDFFDLQLEPRGSNEDIVIIKLRCERVNENEGSFEAFAKQMDGDIAKVKDMVKAKPKDHEGYRILVVGFSNEPIPDDDEDNPIWKTKPPPRVFESAGQVHAWVWEYSAAQKK